MTQIHRVEQTIFVEFVQLNKYKKGYEFSEYDFLSNINSLNG